MDAITEVKYLVGAIEVVKKERSSPEQMERLRTLELCLLLAAKRL